MILHTVAFISAAIIVVTGVYILARGDWRSHQLKFAGVCISTSAALYMLTISLMFNGFNYCTNEGQPFLCHTIEIYYIARNVALILFHIAIGRDAIRVKQYDRRGTACRMSSPKPSHR